MDCFSRLVITQVQLTKVEESSNLTQLALEIGCLLYTVDGRRGNDILKGDGRLEGDSRQYLHTNCFISGLSA